MNVPTAASVSQLLPRECLTSHIRESFPLFLPLPYVYYTCIVYVVIVREKGTSEIDLAEISSPSSRSEVDFEL